MAKSIIKTKIKLSIAGLAFLEETLKDLRELRAAVFKMKGKGNCWCRNRSKKHTKYCQFMKEYFKNGNGGK